MREGPAATFHVARRVSRRAMGLAAGYRASRARSASDRRPAIYSRRARCRRPHPAVVAVAGEPHRRRRGDRAAGGRGQGAGRERHRRRGDADPGRRRGRRAGPDPRGRRRRRDRGRRPAAGVRAARHQQAERRRGPVPHRHDGLPRRGAGQHRVGVARPHPVAGPRLGGRVRDPQPRRGDLRPPSARRRTSARPSRCGTCSTTRRPGGSSSRRRGRSTGTSPRRCCGCRCRSPASGFG